LPCIIPPNEQVARTADFAVRVFSVAIITAVPYFIAVSKLRRPFLSDRYFFIVARLLRRREKFTEPDFALLARVTCEKERPTVTTAVTVATIL
jgi:hypothetical protein